MMDTSRSQRLTVELVGAVGSAASILGLMFAVREPAGLGLTGWVLGGIGAVAIAASVITAIKSFSAAPREFAKGPQQDAKIRTFMKRWIEAGNKVAILSRDMSWADDDGIGDLLRRKARDQELILAVPKHTPRTIELEKLGAETIILHAFPEGTKSRFTLINVGHGKESVAVASPGPSAHRIYTSDTPDPIQCLANDFLYLLRNAGAMSNGPR